MNSVYLKIFKRFFLFTTFIFAITGCGSSSSTANNETGSIAAKLVWSSEATKPAKTLYAAPTGIINIRVFVSGVGISPDIVKDFTATPGSDGSGTIFGIPAGNMYTVTVYGMDSGGYLRYKGVKTSDVIVTGKTTPVTIPLYPVTTASTAGGTYNTGFGVTLTSGESATIYYTTNGTNPTTSSASDVGSVTNIQINPGPSVTLTYFAGFQGLLESIKSQIYSIVPLTSASPVGGGSGYSYPLTVTLTASEPATIYYTTNGVAPTTSSTNGTSPFDVIILEPATLKFFAIDSGLTQEATRTAIYN